MSRPGRTKSGPDLNRDQLHMSLAMALMRSEVMAEAMNQASDALSKDKAMRFTGLKRELMTQEIGPVGRWFCRMQLYFATVDVLVKTWYRGRFSHAPVRAVLKQARMVQLLRDFRNDLMHGGPLLNEDVAAFFDELQSIDTWAFNLREACEKYVVAYFATPRRPQEATAPEPVP